MYEFVDNATDVTLEGGPAQLPTTMRITRTAQPLEKLKIMHAGGYEHFELVETSGEHPDQLIYRWTMRTRIAE